MSVKLEKTNEDKDCTTCTDFKDWFNKQNTKDTGERKSKIVSPLSANSRKAQSQEESGKTSTKVNNTTTNKSDVNSEYYDECPLFRDQYGRVAWNYLHTMAAHYPSKPTEVQQTKMVDFINTFAMFFPCKECAADFKQEMAKSPPRVQNNLELSKWFCEQHNLVNTKLGKEQFDCDRVLERWKLGSSKNPKCF